MARKVELVYLRNDSYQPDLRSEGTYLCPMPIPPKVPAGECWHTGLKPHERLYYHQTMASVRCSKRFHQHPIGANDSLEYRLLSRYDHSRESFSEKIDSVLQRESCGATTSWSQVSRKNEPGARIMDHKPILTTKKVVLTPSASELGHPLRIGGLRQKVHPHSVKFICSGIHSQAVNNGFSRQNADGNFFRY